MVFVIFSGGWKKSIAKKIIKEYDKKNVLTQYLTLNSKFWDDTKNAFEKAAEKLERENQAKKEEEERLKKLRD